GGDAMRRLAISLLALGLLASGLAAGAAGCDGVSGTVDYGPPPGADLGHDVFSTPTDTVTRDAPGPGDDSGNDGGGGRRPRPRLPRWMAAPAREVGLPAARPPPAPASTTANVARGSPAA